MTHLAPVRFLFGALALATTGWVLLGTPPATQACPFCDAPTLTLAERFSKADMAVEAKWIDAHDAETGRPAHTTYEVIRVLRSGPESLETGSRIRVDALHTAKAGDRTLLLGTRGKKINWGEPLDLTQTAFNYVLQAPSHDVTGSRRLTYFVKFLEYPDLAISNDAYAEFANASYEDIVPIARQLPHDKVRKWLVSPAAKNRLGLYGMMLGLCGDSADAAYMEKIITLPTDGERLGIDGIMAGYLLLKGDKGLRLIEKTKLNTTAPDRETFAATQALRFMWTYGDGRISQERLRSSMHALLDHPIFAEIAVIDLTRWKDWSIRQRLMQMYKEPDQDPRIKLAILQYMDLASKDTGKPPVERKPQHAQDATEFLQRVRQEDPKTFAKFQRLLR